MKQPLAMFLPLVLISASIVWDVSHGWISLCNDPASLKNGSTIPAQLGEAATVKFCVEHTSTVYTSILMNYNNLTGEYYDIYASYWGEVTVRMNMYDLNPYKKWITVTIENVTESDFQREFFVQVYGGPSEKYYARFIFILTKDETVKSDGRSRQTSSEDTVDPQHVTTTTTSTTTTTRTTVLAPRCPSSSESKCPPGWDPFDQGKCLKVNNLFGWSTYNGVKHLCEDYGGSLPQEGVDGITRACILHHLQLYPGIKIFLLNNRLLDVRNNVVSYYSSGFIFVTCTMDASKWGPPEVTSFNVVSSSWSSGPSSIVDIGSNVKFICNVSGYPVLPNLSIRDDTQKVVSSVKGSNFLTIGMDLVRCKNMGAYICIGETLRYEPVQKMTELVVRNCPPQCPRGLKATHQGVDYITLSWQPGLDGGANQTFHVFLRPTDDNYWLRLKVPDEHSSHTLNVTDLDVDTNYIFKVVASNRFLPVFDQTTCEEQLFTKTAKRPSSRQQNKQVNSGGTDPFPIILTLVFIVLISPLVIGVVVYRKRAYMYVNTVTLRAEESTSPNEDGQQENQK